MVYIHLKNKNGGVATPEFRLPAMVPGSLLLPIGCLIVGRTSEAHTHWIAVDIVGFILLSLFSLLMVFERCIQTYILECFQLHAAFAIAAVAFSRSLAGFGFPLFAPAMYDAFGFGNCFCSCGNRLRLSRALDTLVLRGADTEQQSTCALVTLDELRSNRNGA
ncbi:hypothetical protein BDR06DRAFT_1067248 [Suillus hirtellus]|nr:hypothetical protein BDR06DRAFT_1067248 [Suillus hirtellus]